MKLWDWKDDGAETIGAFGGSIWAWARFDDGSYVFGSIIALVAVLSFVRLVTEVFGRFMLTAKTRYVTKHGLIVVGVSVPPRHYVEKCCEKTVNWCEGNGYLSKIKKDDVLSGVVLEVVLTKGR